MSPVGKTYMERGEPVKVLVQWRTGRHREAHAKAWRPDGGEDWVFQLTIIPEPNRMLFRRAPRNVLIEREDGSLVVRPFRGLRKP